MGEIIAFPIIPRPRPCARKSMTVLWRAFALARKSHETRNRLALECCARFVSELDLRAENDAALRGLVNTRDAILNRITEWLNPERAEQTMGAVS